MHPGTIGSCRPYGRDLTPLEAENRTPGRPRIVSLGLAALAGLFVGAPLAAQEPEPAAPAAESSAPAETAPAAPAAESSAPTAAIPLAHFVPREKLIVYAEFAGLDAYADAWKKTAAYRMLNSTPLGEMLEQVATQLLDKLLEQAPGRKPGGADLVALCKSAARSGWVLAVNAGPKANGPPVGALVLRGAASKENKPLSSRLLGSMMGAEAKPRIERKSGRVLVIVPSGITPDGGWVWWPEKNDLVIGFFHPSNAEAILAAIDGKSPSAADHDVLKQLARPEGSFQPLMTALIDPAAVPTDPNDKASKAFSELLKNSGLTRIDYRWGFDDDALQSVTRLIAPSPRKPLLAVFDQPKLDTKHLIPVPEGVDSFVMLSASPAKVIEAITQLGPPGAVRARIDELYEKVQSQSRIDVEKDLLGNLGPRMAFFIAPGRSAATGDEPAAVPAAGADPMAMLSSIQGVLPKPTLVAEVRDPATFTKSLDALMIAVNKELKAQAIEKAAQEPAAAAPGAGAAQGRGRNEGGGERPARKRSSRETPAPEFRLMPGNIKTYMLVVPSDSPLKLTPPGVRPTIRLEGKYVAFSSTSESARAGLEAAKKKDWKPSADVEQALAHVPADSVFLAVGDPRETVPPVLASLPGTLQTAINTAIAVSAQAQAQRAGGAAAGPASPFGPGAGGGAGMPAAPGRGGRRNDEVGARTQSGPPSGYPGAMSGYPGMSGRPGMGQPGAPSGPGGAQGAQTSMIQLKVDPAKLPKAEDLKALMFPGTFSIAVDDQSIRLVNRESFPNVLNSAAAGGVAGALLLPAIQAAREAARAAAAANAAKAAAGGQPGQAPPAGYPGAGKPPGGNAPGGPPAGAPPGGRARGRSLRDE